MSRKAKRFVATNLKPINLEGLPIEQLCMMEVIHEESESRERRT